MRRNAVLFVLISLCSGFGGSALALAAGLWVLDLTGSPGLAALAGLGTYAPVLAAPWLGALVDRFPRRPLLITVDVLVGLAILALLLDPAPTGIYLVLLVRGIGYVLLDAGETALLPAALPAGLLGDVNGWRSSAQEGMKLVAPPAGAALYAWHGPRPVLLLCAALPLVTALLYAMVRLRAAPAVPAAGPALDRRGVRAGLTELWRAPMRTPVLVAAVAIAVSGFTNAAVLRHLVDDLHRPSTYLGVLSGLQGAGAIAGGLLAGRLLARLRPARVAALGATLFAAACLTWALPWWPAMPVGSVLTGLGLPWTLIAGITAIQTGTPDRLLGRVGATGSMVMFGPITLGIPLGSALSGAGARPPLIIGAALTLGVALAARVSR
ncbi:MFS transporter [Actinoplanes sp. SE50]|uniref:MFS transporter n=1 Tax=unclassified Actinoplanes TaxID=2626549 RepID=UPI00023ECAAA|nr:MULTISPECIES: MFS transporter [unclassified Actinoplanes]AEV82614.1 integral membrane efflux protein [Actinoplanes sp. SE50/110]ATO81010.1 MFS transporter [Actinoplanes sp. SE50]SLL98417.1 MFS transporter [Actinoplanes sp. SE50/110]